VKQQLAWERETSGPWAGTMAAFWNGGGVMSTATNLVFQGRGTGRLVVLDARSGEELHSVDVGLSMMAAPMTYSVRGVQYVAIITGIGGGNGNEYMPGMAAYTYGNRGRVVAFKLGGGAVPRRPEIDHKEVVLGAPPVPRRGDPDQLAEGGKLYLRNCAKCHSNIDGRGSGIPDLRLMNAATHAEFSDILLEGTRVEKGMGNFSDLLDAAEVESLHIYLIDQAWQQYEQRQAGGDWHSAQNR
jgi:quinohemoprotein ethanol dehydrogenase